ncbi:unnamed protein product [Caenorhabditis auriculariae]|uniref:Uncharacterized protein n=1 Tax=Caenorhabditis auriculariae TaxID=2777116 RepID=A0A8S1H976_9PELO|nr:unnamed protein product [Caenorhabditis auriculariae]
MISLKRNFILICVVAECFAAINHNSAVYRLCSRGNCLGKRHRRDEPVVRVLHEGTLSDGTKIQSIKELTEDLPPLPFDEEVENMDDPRVGSISDSGEVLVPVDENGVVLPGFEDLVKPIVLEVNIADIKDSIRPAAVPEDDAKESPDVDESSVVDSSKWPEGHGPSVYPEDERLEEVVEPAKEADFVPIFNNGSVVPPDSQPNLPQEKTSVDGVPKLPEADPVDYSETDEVIKEDNPSEGGASEPVLKPDPAELEQTPLVFDKDDKNESNQEDLTGGEVDEEKEDVDVAVTPTLPSPSGNQDPSIEADDYNPEELEKMAEDLGARVLDKIMGNEKNEVDEGESPGSDAYVLEDPHLSKEEIAKIKEDSDRDAELNPGSNPIIRSGRVGLPSDIKRPDSATSNSISIVLFLVSAFYALY